MKYTVEATNWSTEEPKETAEVSIRCDASRRTFAKKCILAIMEKLNLDMVTDVKIEYPSIWNGCVGFIGFKHGTDDYSLEVYRNDNLILIYR